MTARQVARKSLPELSQDSRPKSKTTGVKRRTFSDLSRYEGFKNRVDSLINDLNDTDAVFQVSFEPCAVVQHCSKSDTAMCVSPSRADSAPCHELQQGQITVLVKYFADQDPVFQ